MFDTRSSQRFTRILLACTVTLICGVSLGNEFQQVSISLGEEQNISRGLDSLHEKSSTTLGVSYRAGKFFQLGLNDSISASIMFSSKRYPDLPGFDAIAVGASADYGHKFGFGAYAPRVGALLSYQHEELRGEARDSELLSLEIYFDKRLNPQWFLSGGFEVQENYSDSLRFDPVLAEIGYDPQVRLPYELFDYNATSLFLDAEYTLPAEVLFTISYRRTDGAVVASTTEPTLKLYKVADAFYSDPAFDAGWFGYQLDAVIDEWSAGLSLPVSRDASVNLGMSWQDIDGPRDKQYDNSLFTISYVHNF